MDDVKSQMRSRDIERKLWGLSGIVFEEHARFLLKLIDVRFNFTRLHSDGNIDGYKFRIRRKNKDDKRGIDIYSITSKELATASDSRGLKRKIKKDFFDAIEAAKNNNYKLEKWLLVINYELPTDIGLELKDICNEQGVEYEFISPTTLVANLRGADVLFEAACYFDAVDSPKAPYTDYSNHKFAQQALLDICEYASKTTDEQLMLIKDIINTILIKCSLDKKIPISYYRYGHVAKVSRIDKGYVFSYKYVGSSFLPCEVVIGEENDIMNILPGSFVHQDENDFLLITIKSLFPLYQLCKALTEQVEDTGTYHLEKALKKCYDNPFFRYRGVPFRVV